MEDVVIQIITDNSTPTPTQPQSAATPNQPQPETEDLTNIPPSNAAFKIAPERTIAGHALQLAIIEKFASAVGALSFIWATVVLLGGFVTALEAKDFWFITIILLIEGIRLLSRSHELELQHQSTWNVLFFRFKPFCALKSFNNRTRNVQKRESYGRDQVDIGELPRSSPNVLLPLNVCCRFSFRTISKLFYWLQILSAFVCVTLSLTRLFRKRKVQMDREWKNLYSTLNIFYTLAFLEASLLIVKCFIWELRISGYKLLDLVNSECQLGPSGVIYLKRFFYDSYSKCVNGSIFDGLKTNLVTFGQELLMSTHRKEQLMGVTILHKLVTNPRFSNDTLRRIGKSTNIVERLIAMLNWKNIVEETIRMSAATVVSELAGKEQNALRIAGISGAMESIASLLTTDGVGSNNSDAFNLLGLHILEKLAKDHDNCGKIGSTPGLLTKIVYFTSVSESKILILKRSLQVLKLLASTVGGTGKVLRRKILGIVFIFGNIRKLLHYTEDPDILQIQKIGIEILTCLSVEEEAREKIWATGDMIGKLLLLYSYGNGATIMQEIGLRSEAAGEALAMITLDNVKNSERILNKNQVVKNLVANLVDPVVTIRISSFRILKNLCASKEYNHCHVNLRRIVSATPIVLDVIMNEEGKLLEAALGLASEILRFLSYNEFCEIYRTYFAGVNRSELEVDGDKLVKRIVHLLKMHDYPSIKVPETMRFLVEMTIWLVIKAEGYTELFQNSGMVSVLWQVADTVSELECFRLFSGSEGLSRHSEDFSSIIDYALILLGFQPRVDLDLDCNLGCVSDLDAKKADDNQLAFVHTSHQATY